MASVQPTSDSLESVRIEILIARYTQVATVAFLVYDYFLTLEDERRLVWSSRFTAVKVLFFVNRYLPFISSIGLLYALVIAGNDDNTCRHLFLAFGNIIYVHYVVSEAILYARTYAVWGQNTSILGLLTFVYILLVIPFVYIAARITKSIDVSDLPLLQDGCLYQALFKFGWAAFVLLILSETFSLTVLLARAYNVSESIILQTIYTDGVMFYFFALLLSLANVFIMRLASPILRTFFVVPQAALHSVFCTRLLLRIRIKGSRDVFLEVMLLEDVEPRLSIASEPRERLETIPEEQ